GPPARAARRPRPPAAHPRGPRPAGRAARGAVRAGGGDHAMTRADRSQALFERATRVIPGGVNSPVRAFGGGGGTPRFFARGRGPYLEDVDGNRYVDLVCSWGPLIAGHAHPRVVEAVQSATARGTSFGAPTEAEVELAEEVAR